MSAQGLCFSSTSYTRRHNAVNHFPCAVPKVQREDFQIDFGVEIDVFADFEQSKEGLY